MRLKSFPLVTPAVFLLAILLGVVYLQQVRSRGDESGDKGTAGTAQGKADPQIVSGRRPSPEAVKAWQDRKFGMFIHWGLYSVLGGVWKGERVTDIYSEQIMLRAPIPLAEYAPVASSSTPSDGIRARWRSWPEKRG